MAEPKSVCEVFQRVAADSGDRPAHRTLGGATISWRDYGERVRLAFGDARYRRLQAIKAVWDPDDVFRHCAHIPPV